jgi:hypothetical protein
VPCNRFPLAFLDKPRLCSSIVRDGLLTWGGFHETGQDRFPFVPLDSEQRCLCFFFPFG